MYTTIKSCTFICRIICCYVCICKQLNMWLKLLYLISGLVVFSNFCGVVLQIWWLIGMITIFHDFSLRCQPPYYANINSIGGCIGYCIYSVFVNSVLPLFIYIAAGLPTIRSKKRNDLKLSNIFGCVGLFFLAVLTITFISMSIVLTILVHDNPCPPIDQ